MEPASEVTRLLSRWCSGDKQAFNNLVPILYRDLRRAAARYLDHERSGHTLQPTALVNEAYLRLVDHPAPPCENRAHFVAIAARVMRQILVEHARAHSAAKRGYGQPKLMLEEIATAPGECHEDFLDLDRALSRLSVLDERKSQAIEMRYFGGLAIEEIARVLDISAVTVRRDLRFAEAWLRLEMRAL
jgi:RNA polymerase sigma-70 factor (ECF subfamily)